MQKAELTRYVVNGLFAALFHFAILNFNMSILNFNSAGVANTIAAILATAVSFVGSRYYVYRGHKNSLNSQIVRFAVLYISVALLHGFILYLWHDIYNLNYNVGFLIATSMQVVLSYLGNKRMVFKNEI